MTKLTLVEDDPELASNYIDLFTGEGWTVSHYTNRAHAFQGILKEIPDIAIVDIGLGPEEEGGFELCRQLRAHPETNELGVIILTAREDQEDRILGLNLGADDYCSKTESSAYIIAVVGSLLRRIGFRRSPEKINQRIITQGYLKLDLDNEYATWRDYRLNLTRTQFEMVEKLARYPGMLKRKEDLMREGTTTESSTVRKNISRLKEEFLRVDSSFNAIVTEHGRGYIWQKDSQD